MKKKYFSKVIYRAGGIISTDYGNVIKYLLVKGRESHKWSFSKGQRDNNESVWECAIREIHEETGCILNKNNLKSNKILNYSQIYYYTFHVNSNINLNVCDTKEIIDIKWFTFDEISKFKYTETNRSLKIFIQNYYKNHYSNINKQLTFKSKILANELPSIKVIAVKKVTVEFELIIFEFELITFELSFMGTRDLIIELSFIGVIESSNKKLTDEFKLITSKLSFIGISDLIIELPYVKETEKLNL